jgi:hypothetical protein
LKENKGIRGVNPLSYIECIKLRKIKVMATRSRIAIEKQDGTVDSIYCHSDGYIDGVGKTLFKNYSDREKVEKLIELGDLSSLRSQIEPDPTKPHTFNNPQDDVTVAYHRDRGEDLYKSTDKDVETFFSGNFEQYGYLFTKDNRWIVSRGGPVTDLSLALKGEDVL